MDAQEAPEMRSLLAAAVGLTSLGSAPDPRIKTLPVAVPSKKEEAEAERASVPLKKRKPPSSMEYTAQHQHCSANANSSEKPENLASEPLSFPETLYAILSDPSYASIISWLPHGNAFAIFSRDRFKSEIMPRHFPGSRFTSFTRRLKRWHFERIPRGPELGAYHRKCFVRGRPELVRRMVYGADEVMADGDEGGRGEKKIKLKEEGRSRHAEGLRKEETMVAPRSRTETKKEPRKKRKKTAVDPHDETVLAAAMEVRMQQQQIELQKKLLGKTGQLPKDDESLHQRRKMVVHPQKDPESSASLDMSRSMPCNPLKRGYGSAPRMDRTRTVQDSRLHEIEAYFARSNGVGPNHLGNVQVVGNSQDDLRQYTHPTRWKQSRENRPNGEWNGLMLTSVGSNQLLQKQRRMEDMRAAEMAAAEMAVARSMVGRLESNDQRTISDMELFQRRYLEHQRAGDMSYPKLPPAADHAASSFSGRGSVASVDTSSSIRGSMGRDLMSLASSSTLRRTTRPGTDTASAQLNLASDKAYADLMAMVSRNVRRRSQQLEVSRNQDMQCDQRLSEKGLQDNQKQPQAPSPSLQAENLVNQTGRPRDMENKATILEGSATRGTDEAHQAAEPRDGSSGGDRRNSRASAA